MSKLIWVTNTKEKETLGSVLKMRGQTELSAWQEWNDTKARFIKGRPKSSSKYTVEQLEAKGIIGLYREAKI